MGVEGRPTAATMRSLCVALPTCRATVVGFPSSRLPMDVTCERCKTGYEFDDALVSERGTSVRCTTCGHTFKVRRPGAAGPMGKDAPGAAKERWLVRTIDGRELEFR